MDIYREITEIIKKASRDAGFDIEEVHIEHPADIAFGDISTNVAMVESKKLSKSPKEIAEAIALKLKENGNELIRDVSVAGPGFINITLENSFFSKETERIIKIGEKYGSNDDYRGYKTIFEYTDPNPLKIFHIGHLMSNTVGESISRITEFHNAEVKRACYFGDVGVHIAKTVYAMREMTAEYESAKSLVEKVSVLGKAYANGNRLYEDDPKVKTEIDNLNVSLYKKEDTPDYKMFLLARDVSLEYFETIYKKVGTHFDYYFPESEVADQGKKIVEEYKEKGIFEESEGAIVFKAEKHDPKLHTRVFLNKLGLPTYEAKELALAQTKYEKYPYDVSVVITANEIAEYFKVLKKAMYFIYPELEKKTYHLPHGFLKLPDGKMSSRKGTIISAEELIDNVKDEVLKKMQDREIEESEKEITAERIAIGAIKYSILKQAIGKDVIFSMDKALSFEGDSGPYIQYALVRAKSIDKKAEELGIEAKANDEVFPLQRLLYRFPMIVKKAGKEHAPHHITTFLTEIASEFNSFYAKEKVAESNDADSQNKLATVKAFIQVLENGMSLLAIPKVERM